MDLWRGMGWVVRGILYGYSVYICAREPIVCAVAAFLPFGGHPYTWQWYVTFHGKIATGAQQRSNNLAF